MFLEEALLGIDKGAILKISLLVPITGSAWLVILCDNSERNPNAPPVAAFQGLHKVF